MNTAHNIKELPALLGGAPIGTTFSIEGYIDSDGQKKDMTIRTLGPDAYARMKSDSLKILQDTPAPVVPGFPPLLLAQARDALMASYGGSSSKPFLDLYTAAPEGGYSTKPGEEAIYILRAEDVAPRSKEIVDPRTDLVRAKAALVRTLDLPAGRYLHAIKLVDGKFTAVKKV